MKKLLVVGAGFSGAVLARELAALNDVEVLVIDRRSHLAGNCHTSRDDETGVMVHRYGAHIFHTSDLEVWNYVRRFSEFMPFINRPKVSIASGIYSFPINLHTINQFFGVKLNPADAVRFIAAKREPIAEPQNFEEQALQFVGRELYEAFFKGYTQKQWGCDPRELPASILKRLPVRFNYNDNYYDSIYQGIPVEGYTAIVEAILAHERIEVKLATSWEEDMQDEFEHVFFTGPIDARYAYRFGRLSYRTVYWDRAVHAGDFQGHPGINYPGLDVPYTRIREHKHYTPWEHHDKTVVFTEYSKDTGADDEPFYPKRLAPDMTILRNYAALAQDEQRLSFLGRLGTYRYLDMHQVIREALDFARQWSAAVATHARRPVFPENVRASA